jgi:glycosyltransferase involved in cell wall biosynthesis
MQSSLKMDKPIFVSISCITYNHEKFIRQCIEGFLMQKTNFPIEILIFDDASTDGAQQIIQEYASKDHRIITFLQNENQWSKGKYGLLDWLFPAAKGKYIALCEGDDYWTDPLKLQKQVDFLEANPEYVLCFHKVVLLKNGKETPDILTKNVPDITDVLTLSDGNYMHTASVVFKKNNTVLNEFFEIVSSRHLFVGDYILHMLNAKFGKIKKLHDTMGVYRIHEVGVHSLKPQIEKNKDWMYVLLAMIPFFNKEVKTKLINNFTILAKTVLIENELKVEEKTEILSYLYSFNPSFTLDLLEEIKILKNDLRISNQNLNSSRMAIKTILNAVFKTLRFKNE